MMQIKNWFTGDVIFTSHTAKTARDALADAKNNGIDIKRGSIYVTAMAITETAKDTEAEEREIQKKYYEIDKDEIIKKIFYFRTETAIRTHIKFGFDGDRLVYNPFYILYICFTPDQLLAMSEIELQNSLKLARVTFCMTRDYYDCDCD